MALAVDVVNAPRHGCGHRVTHAMAPELYTAVAAITFVCRFDSVRSQRRINARQGEIKLLMDSRLRWQGKEWDILGMPWMLNSGMMLRLRNVDGGRCQHLWLAADSMDASEWRDLRRMLLQQPTQE